MKNYKNLTCQNIVLLVLFYTAAIEVSFFFVSVKNGVTALKKTFCDFCLFDRDMTMFSYDFFNLGPCK